MKTADSETAETPWIGARWFGRHCALEGLPRAAPEHLPPDAENEFYDAYDKTKAESDRAGR